MSNKDQYPYGGLHSRPATPAEVAKAKDKAHECGPSCTRRRVLPCPRCILILKWVADGCPVIDQTILHPVEIQGFSN